MFDIHPFELFSIETEQRNNLTNFYNIMHKSSPITLSGGSLYAVRMNNIPLIIFLPTPLPLTIFRSTPLKLPYSRKEE